MAVPENLVQQISRMKPYTPRCSSCRDKDGNLISDRMGILKRWVEYFDELLNNQNIGELEVPSTEVVHQLVLKVWDNESTPDD